MYNPFEYRGFWWLPGKYNENVEGVLKYNPGEELVLELTGSLTDLKKVTEDIQHDIILGFSSNGKKITLYKCLSISLNVSMPGFPTQTFIASAAFIGEHFESIEEVRFKEVNVHYFYLEEWLRISGMNINVEQNNRERYFCIHYYQPDDIKVLIDNWILAIYFTVNYSRDRADGLKIKETAVVSFQFKEGLPFEEILNKIIGRWEDFFTFATGEAAFPSAIKAFVEKDSKHRETEIVYRRINGSTTPKKLTYHDMLFTFRDIQEKFGAFLNNWFSKAEVLRPVYNLFFGLRYNPGGYLQYQFLTLAQALETYHRRTKCNYVRSPDKYEKMMNEILNSIPNKYVEWLKEKLKYSNEPTLRHRIRDIFKDFGLVVDKYIGDVKGFINEVVEARNYLTHYDKSKETEKGKDHSELYNLVKKLEVILDVCLLYELGFSLDKVEELLSRNPRYRNLLENIE
ncbi:HEPN domain-containing protein [Neomoorella thermoacetica]|uniref:ApeA N-terminal domain 1-containing protein n=1 Tax=Neomoorella thermoacetica TaxID=1525 RepID=UPI00091B4D35|nr:HEPN domain-containing protein [Moorella thermoacetica]OIQ55193.1 hypothetical protein MORE_09480 [Moorella thermoacetica]